MHSQQNIKAVIWFVGVEFSDDGGGGRHRNRLEFSLIL
jgi:hypothetical protein